MARVCQSRFLDRTFGEAVECVGLWFGELFASMYRVFNSPGSATMGDFLTTAGVVAGVIAISLWVLTVVLADVDVGSPAPPVRTPPVSAPPENPFALYFFFLSIPLLSGGGLLHAGWDRGDGVIALIGAVIILGSASLLFFAFIGRRSKHRLARKPGP